MDGNGRWACERGLPRIEGHRVGAESVKEVVRQAAELKIRHLTLYAFSVENWQRPPDEVSGLMQMLERFLKDHSKELIKRSIRFRAIGRVDELPPTVRKEVIRVETATAGFRDWHLNLALNYGSRTEVADAVKAYALAVRAGLEDPAECDWDKFSRYLYTFDLPDPDLIIRTSGETRLSNFLLLQSAYAEIFFSPVLWPDFRGPQLLEAVEFYAKRERRFGKTGEQVRGKPAVEPILSL